MVSSKFGRVIPALLAAVLVSGTHVQVVGAGETEVLQFRHTKAKTVHLPDEQTAKSYEENLKKLGVDVKMHGHAGHFDLTYKCADWQKAEFGTHAEVTKWQKWLKSLGFETQHQH